MSTWITLLRGINVGGRNKLPMKALTSLLENLGCTDVKTYIQSGNAVFRHNTRSATQLSDAIRGAIAAEHGFEPAVLLLKPAELRDAVASNPFPEAAAEADGKRLHAIFLATKPETPDLEVLEAVRQPDESWELINRALYLVTPSGFHKSKLAAKAERVLGVQITARNWRTTMKLLEMVEAM